MLALFGIKRVLYVVGGLLEIRPSFFLTPLLVVVPHSNASFIQNKTKYQFTEFYFNDQQFQRLLQLFDGGH
jgi:hypothetical protein